MGYKKIKQPVIEKGYYKGPAVLSLKGEKEIIYIGDLTVQRGHFLLQNTILCSTFLTSSNFDASLKRYFSTRDIGKKHIKKKQIQNLLLGQKAVNEFMINHGAHLIYEEPLDNKGDYISLNSIDKKFKEALIKFRSGDFILITHPNRNYVHLGNLIYSKFDFERGGKRIRLSDALSMYNHESLLKDKEVNWRGHQFYNNGVTFEKERISHIHWQREIEIYSNGLIIPKISKMANESTIFQPLENAINDILGAHK